MSAGSYVVETTRTAEVEAGERTELWTERVGTYHPRMDYRFGSPASFRGELIRQHSATYQIVTWHSGEIEYARTPGLIRQTPDPDYRLLIPLSGEMRLRQADEEVRMGPGTGSLFTLGTPFELRHGDSLHGVVMSIPAQEIEGPLNSKAPLVAGLDLTKGLGRVLHTVVRSLHEERDDLTAAQFDAVCDRVVEMLRMLAVGDDRPTGPGHLTEVEAMVRRHVRAHAADPTLSGTSMARALGWSLRQIQLALQQVGTTPRDLIREERLRLVRDRLRCPDCDHLTITDLAYASGFSSASAMGTAFHRRFGVSPREMRRRDR
ncbi:transcriptional regulator [Streptomyces sp. NBRC 14336]|uniref:AraC-like ligand-binding domain-containing protein n=1 Tax=Streptomyces sp. NBRC 14336 TaxID=3030992 RepID=UPI0024A20C3E|nr:helix-turn-helix domain-containing protein [Streptomyces sp. NBRC 14336]GLW46505.1 transcriptional regulator [Streptomyces sp. NBRC 14336]